MDPDADVALTNRLVRVVTKDGKSVTGRLLNHDNFTVQFIDPQGKLHSYVKADLKESTVLTKGLMPSYKDRLSSQEVADVVAYLATLKGPVRHSYTLSSHPAFRLLPGQYSRTSKHLWIKVRTSIPHTAKPRCRELRCNVRPASSPRPLRRYDRDEIERLASVIEPQRVDSVNDGCISPGTRRYSP